MPRPQALSIAERDAIVTFVRGRASGEIRIDEDGWDSVVVIADGLVYRFPRGQWALDRIQAEVAFLRAFAPLSPTPVPMPQLLDDPVRTEYPLVKGEPLLPSRLAAWSAAERRQGAQALGHFLTALHAFPVDRALAIGLPRDAWTDTWWLGEEFRAKVPALLGPRGRQLAERVLEATDPSALQSPREVVVHNDLGPEHILADGTTMSGVIDFGDAAVGDPALDFQWSVMHYDDDRFLKDVLARYEHPIDDGFFARVATYRTYHGLHHVWDESQCGNRAALDEAVTLFERAAGRLQL